MKCTDCHKESTHYSPLYLCDFHYAERFSTQFINGQDIPFKQLFRDNLMKRNLWKKPEETRDEWNQRCQDAGKNSKWLPGNIVKE
jgi:hypothetical protein|tara:strand:- start:7427 stop:7681 length:255 start_codon:yes stop_codon:yes gene_type:complete